MTSSIHPWMTALLSSFGTLMTFLVSRPRYTLVGLGVGLLRRRSRSSFLADLDLGKRSDVNGGGCSRERTYR